MKRIGRSIVVVASALLGVAEAQPLRDAFDALRAGDCVQVGKLVNENLDTDAGVVQFAGVIYEEGLCVERDLDRARRYYDAPSTTRDWRSAIEIGLMYLQGDALPRSYTKAGAWFARSSRLSGSESSYKFPGLATLPVKEATAATEWGGYLISVGFVGSRTVKYPSEAIRVGAEGSYLARVCLVDGTVQVQAVATRPGPAAGTASLTGKRLISEAIDDAYRKAMQTMPRPKYEPIGHTCFEQPLSFRIR
jgi:hypothetical protein